MTRTIIVPGLNGSPHPHWQFWWHRTDRSSILVEQADWSAPNAADWDVRIAKVINAHPGARIVAHSLGATAILRIAARWPVLDIGGALLVAPADVETGIGAELLGHFRSIPRIPLPFPTIVAASRNDVWMDFAKIRDLADDWGARLIDLGRAGHVNAEAGFGRWPAGKALLETLPAGPADRPAPFLPAPMLRPAALAFGWQS